MRWHWISGTRDRTGKISAWKIWNIFCGLKPWRLKVAAHSQTHHNRTTMVASFSYIIVLVFSLLCETNFVFFIFLLAVLLETLHGHMSLR